MSHKYTCNLCKLDKDSVAHLQLVDENDNCHKKQNLQCLCIIVQNHIMAAKHSSLDLYVPQQSR